ncbi:MAG: fumarylacetoacetate hydrolase family protein [Hyphomonas sp.]|nr:fumarylacetoacetate hydrolase family protein [Hyphomonas sp.]
MKMASFSTEGRDSYGVLLSDGRIVDLGARMNSSASTLKEFLSLDDGEAQARAIIDSGVSDGSLEDVTLAPPIPDPGAIWCAGINTHSHFKEVAHRVNMAEEPPYPLLFMRGAATLVASGDTLEKPKLEKLFDYEGEIAIVIGKRARNVSPEEAMAHIGGYSAFNDATARGYQRTSSQMTAGKNAYRSGGFGPYITLASAIDPKSLTMQCRVNGEVRQNMDTGDLIFGFGELVSFISEFTWLEPGDVIVTGSPIGIGAVQKPPRTLQAGDVVEVEVSGVGTLVNTVADQPAL